MSCLVKTKTRILVVAANIQMVIRGMVVGEVTTTSTELGITTQFRMVAQHGSEPRPLLQWRRGAQKGRRLPSVAAGSVLSDVSGRARSRALNRKGRPGAVAAGRGLSSRSQAGEKTTGRVETAMQSERVAGCASAKTPSMTQCRS